MNKKFILLLLFFQSISIYATQQKKIIVAFSLNDCISGSASLHQLNKELNNPEMTILFQSELIADSALVAKKVGLNNFKSSKVIYSDSLYNKFSNGVKSTINIVENDEKIYSADIYQLNIKDFLNVYLKNDSTCFENTKSGAKFVQDEKSFLVWNFQLGRWTYYNENNQFDVLADDSWTKQAYDIYYSADLADKKFSAYETLAKEYPALDPKILKGIKINDHELLFSTGVHFIETDETSNDIILQKTFFFTYNIPTQKITSIKHLNSEPLSKMKYYINPEGFKATKDGYLITLTADDYSQDNNIKYLALFENNPKNPNELILKKVLDTNIPNNYLKYKLEHNFNSYLFDKSLVLLSFGEFIYDYEKDVQYKIPFPESEFNALNNIFDAVSGGKSSHYFIQDIADKDTSILLLYSDQSKNLKLMEIDKKSQKAIKDNIIMKPEEYESEKNSWLNINSDGEIQYLNKKNCIIKIQS